MKILLLGHKGYLGSYLAKNLPVDILLGRGVYGNGINYDYVINCIGIPNLEYCEKNKEECKCSNQDIVSDITKIYPSAKLIHFSTYYVYDDEGLCNEDSKTTDKYQYTKRKLKSEKLVENGVIFRVGKLFGNPYSTQNKLFDHILENDNLVLDSVLFNPTSVDQVLKVVKFEISTNSLSGVYNLANLGFTSPYKLGIFINEQLGENKDITKVERMSKPFHNYGRFLMDVSKLNNKFPLTDWKEDLKKYIDVKYR